MHAATDLLWSPVLRKFPNLQFALSEGGTGWIPYWLERIDYVYQQHRFWTHQDFGDQLPSQVARDHFTYCFISDRTGVVERDAIGDRQHHVGVRLPALRLELAELARSRWPSSSTACPTTRSTR